jgi:hypothetical protein
MGICEDARTVTCEAPPLSAELEAELLRELVRAYQLESYLRFDDRLVTPVIVLADTGRELGSWRRATRTLALSRAFVLDHPWPEVIGLLAHEMAHQFVDEVLEVRDEPPHGPTFARVCAERGVDGRAAGAPVALDDGAADRVLERIRKLLALAASANQHEAELAMRRAHELMLRHNLEEAAARAERGFEVRHVGDPTRRGTRVEAQIVGVLAEFFFVEAIRIPVYLPRLGVRGHAYELCGTRANVEMACHVHAFLLATAERLWQDNRGDARVKSGRDRVAYQSGVIHGFRCRLLLERAQLEGTGLVWTGDTSLERFYRARHPKIVSRRSRTEWSRAHAAGREAGNRIVLHRPVEHGGSSGTRLLRG